MLKVIKLNPLQIPFKNKKTPFIMKEAWIINHLLKPLYDLQHDVRQVLHV